VCGSGVLDLLEVLALSNLVAEYSYGLAVKGRFLENGAKTFRWRMAGVDDWGGLEGLKETDLPLYGDAWGPTIFVCEGEKAVDACRKAGLSAVCLAGGAGAKTFGDALGVLSGKTVVLWPDNDPVGREFMQRLRRELEPIALLLRVVAPPVPLKGDAYDYFEAGGATAMLLPAGFEPVVEQVETGYLVTLPDLMGTAAFLFEELEAPKAGELTTEATVSYESPGKRRETFSARTNLMSLSARKMLASELEAMMPQGKGEWARLINNAVEMVRTAWVSAVVSLEYPDVLIDRTLPRYRVDRFLPEGAVTTLFGMGDSGKGQIAINLSLCIGSGRAFMGRACLQGRVMYCDWEDDEGEWAQRLYRHSLGMRVEVPDGLSYYSGRGIPLQQQVSALQREVNRRNADVLIVDSAVPACGGDPNKPDVPGPFFNALRRLGCTVVLVAHNDKKDDDRYPIGSIMFHNLTRCSWYVSRSEGEDFIVGLYHKKRNRMKPQPPFGMRIVFSEDDFGPVTFYGQDIKGDMEQLKNMRPRERILSLLQAGPMLRKELCEAARVTGAGLRLAIYRDSRLVADGDYVRLAE